MSDKSLFSFHGDASSLVLDCRGNAPAILYWGPRLRSEASANMITDLSTRYEPWGSPHEEVAISLNPTDGEGFSGHTGLQVHRAGKSWGVYATIVEVVEHSAHSLSVECSDPHTGVDITYHLKMHPASGVISSYTQVTNKGSDDLTVDWCAASTIAIAPQYTDILAYEGRWAKEFQLKRQKRVCGTYLRENRKGRTSHDNFPGILLAEKDCNEVRGQVYGFHLGWSGNHRTCVEEMYDGRALLQMGELLLPGEVILKSGERYETPILYGQHSEGGLSGIAQGFHRFVRETLLSDLVKNKPRPIHFNTWEALYFDHDPEVLKKMADDAADVGAERFVLDDGWFRHRRHERAGLGDWYVEESIYPEGLTPLIDHVKSKGMEFGLWVEPEMVNPDSDLYRAHPDWVLEVPHAKTVGFRYQLVLDLTRQEVSDYLFSRMDALLTEYDIAYVKWDMNRDINQPGGHLGKAAIHEQTLALYALIQKIRASHPTVEIESCSSGGARADYGILRYTDRIWTSDSNDALDRLSIQKGISLFFPAELMGAHIGPSECHITSRKLDISLRASTALFGHMGMEVDLQELSADEKVVLKAALALHKKHRTLIHSGNLVRSQFDEFSDSFGIVSQAQDEALYSYTELGGYPRHITGRYHFHGLDKESTYEINIVWPSKLKTPTIEYDLSSMTGAKYSGEALLYHGLQLPILLPESNIIFHLTKIDHS